MSKVEVRGVSIDLDPMTWVIVGLVALHWTLDLAKLTVTTLTKRGT